MTSVGMIKSPGLLTGNLGASLHFRTESASSVCREGANMPHATLVLAVGTCR